MNKPIVDRPVEDIILSLNRLIVNGQIKGQLARDIEKLCAIASKTQSK